MATTPTLRQSLVLLVEPSAPRHHHAEVLTRAGFRVITLPPHEVTPSQIDDLKPAIIAIELEGNQPNDALNLAPRLRGVRPPPRGIPIPVIVYGHGLSAADIERAATGGAMWLQLEPADGAKLVAAIRDVLAAPKGT